MSGGLVAVLLVLWAGVLLPGAWRDHRRSPVATVDGFTDAMRRLGGGGDGSAESRNILVPGNASRMVAHPPQGTRAQHRSARLKARRLAVLVRLAGVSGVMTLLALVVGGGFAWTLALVSLAGLGGYVAVLRSLAVRAAEVRRIVRTHPAAGAQPADRGAHVGGPDRSARGASAGPAPSEQVPATGTDGPAAGVERAVGEGW